MLMPFLVSYLIYCQFKKRIVVNQYMLLVIAVMCFFLLYGRFVFAYYLFSDRPGEMFYVIKESMASVSGWGIVKDLLSNFSSPYLSLDASLFALETRTLNYRYFVDIPMGVLFYLRMIGVNMGDTVAYYNTYILTGQTISHVPPAIIGLGIYSLGFIGIIIVSALYGILLRIVRALFLGTEKSPIFMMYRIVSGMLIGVFVSSGEPRLLVLKSLPIILGMIVMLYQRKRSNVYI